MVSHLTPVVTLTHVVTSTCWHYYTYFRLFDTLTCFYSDVLTTLTPVVNLTCLTLTCWHYIANIFTCWYSNLLSLCHLFLNVFTVTCWHSYTSLSHQMSFWRIDTLTYWHYYTCCHSYTRFHWDLLSLLVLTPWFIVTLTLVFSLIIVCLQEVCVSSPLLSY